MDGHLGVFQLHNGAQSASEVAVVIDQQMLQVVVHPSLTALHRARPPGHSIQQGDKEFPRMGSEVLHDVWVPFEEFVQAVVVPGSVSADRHQILKHGLSRLHVATLNSSQEGRDRLGANRHVQHPHRPLSAGGVGQGSPHLLGAVGVDCLHHHRRALLNRPHKKLAHERKGPVERVRQLLITCQLLQGDPPAFHEEFEEVHGHPVAHMAQAQR
mmetsp:Transcript_63633/g.152123  ORF Transcript_63633/g.152123 Transcript_63633/m.152123 type:complete len:213 (+) Transcript_63633:642-1280(+)